MKLGFLHSRIRTEEKFLLDGIRRRNNIEIVDMNDDEIIFDLANIKKNVDVVLERCINHSRALYSLKIFNDNNIPTVNEFKVADICGSKFLTTQALLKNKVRTPRCFIAYTPQSALKAMEKLGYPCVLKPAVGSWGRLISKVNDRDAAETVLEHKQILGSYHHSIFYIQEYIPKEQGRDIRSFVVGDDCICAIYRTSPHWITNTARGGSASNCPVSDELREISLKAAEAVGGGVLAVDVFETKQGLSVNEVNYTMEFRNSIKTTGVNIPEKIIDFVEQVAKK